MADVCIDASDFEVDPNGLLKLNATYVQSVAQSFVHTLTGAPDVYEDINEFSDVILTVAGLWLVTMDVRGNATITPAGIGTVVGAKAACELRQNGASVPGTETMLQLTSQGSPDTSEPALQLHGSGSATRVIQAAAGDALQIWGKRNSDAGTTTTIASDTSGRCRITAVRIGSA